MGLGINRLRFLNPAVLLGRNSGRRSETKSGGINQPLTIAHGVDTPSINTVRFGNVPFVDREPRTDVISEIQGMLERWDERPDPHRIRELVFRRNMSQRDILDAATNLGMTVPDMGEIFGELKVVLPLIHQVVDTLAMEHRNDTLLFAGRDGDYLYDAYVAKFGQVFQDQTAVLLPGSSSLWGNISLHDRDIARRFLQTYGITEKAVRESIALGDKGSKFVIVDSGFRGSIGERVRDLVARTFGLSEAEVTKQFPTKLTSASDYPAENTTQICRYNDRALGHDDLRRNIPRGYYAYHGTYSSSSRPITPDKMDEMFSTSFGTAIQVLPHYHETYQDVVERDGRVIGVPTDRKSATTFDQRSHGSINASFVHPVAALIVQTEAIRHILGITDNDTLRQIQEHEVVRKVGIGSNFQRELGAATAFDLPERQTPNTRSWYAILSTNERTDDSFRIKDQNNPVDGYIVGVGFGNVFGMLDLLPTPNSLPKAVIAADVIPEVVLAGRVALSKIAKSETFDDFMSSIRQIDRYDIKDIVRGELNWTVRERLEEASNYVFDLFSNGRFPIGRGGFLNQEMITILRRNFSRIKKLVQEENIAIVLADLTSDKFISAVRNLDGYRSSRNVVYVSNIIDHITERGNVEDRFGALDPLSGLETSRGSICVDTNEQVLDYTLRIGDLPPRYSRADFPWVYGRWSR